MNRPPNNGRPINKGNEFINNNLEQGLEKENNLEHNNGRTSNLGNIREQYNNLSETTREENSNLPHNNFNTENEQRKSLKLQNKLLQHKITPNNAIQKLNEKISSVSQ